MRTQSQNMPDSKNFPLSNYIILIEAYPMTNNAFQLLLVTGFSTPPKYAQICQFYTVVDYVGLEPRARTRQRNMKISHFPILPQSCLAASASCLLIKCLDFK